ncbi:hypothetical protein SCACP_05820 [Sporomusa carbonis]|uniref:L,D-transpeptidase n=1 Tax=Sporomusa carbonis TaxID=3076075 RepID=UPI003A7049E1
MPFVNLHAKKARTRFGIILAALFFTLAGLWLFEYIDAAVLNYSISQATRAPAGEIHIVIKIPDRVLELYDGGKLFKRYRVAVGKKATPTPVGEWNIIYKGFSQEAALGTRWLGLDVPWGTSLLEYTKNTYITAYNLTDNYLPLYFV